jgi:uncharacterized protein (TIGR02145 family)
VSGTFTDQRDGNTYQTVQLRDGKTWMAENLRYEMPGSYPADENPDQGPLGTHPRYNSQRYGRLYNWDAAQDCAPNGWHPPKASEWEKMLNAYGGFGPLHGEINATGRNDSARLILEEFDVEFGGCVTSPPMKGSKVCYTYFGGFMGGRFWTASKPLFDSKSGIYFLLFVAGDRSGCSDAERKRLYEEMLADRRARFPNFRVDSEAGFIGAIDGLPSIGTASKSQENLWNAFSVRCVKD